MTNEDFWQSILNIIHQGFTQNGLSKLEEYAENFISQQLIYKRFSPSEQHGCIEGGTNHVIASLLAGAEVGTNQLSAPEHSFKRKQQLGKIQEKQIEFWAKASNRRIEDTKHLQHNKTLGELLVLGEKAIVYGNGNSVLKVNGLDNFIQPIFALDRITLQSLLILQT